MFCRFDHTLFGACSVVSVLSHRAGTLPPQEEPPLPQLCHKCTIGVTHLTIGPPVSTMSSMSPTSVVASSALHVGVKGRVVLPAAVRRAAHLEEGAEVVARPDGEGRVVIETIASVRERIWNAAPQPTGADTVADVRELRDADELLCAANMARQARELGSEPVSYTHLTLPTILRV